MKYFEITYLINGKKSKIILKSNHKINALKNFYSMSLGILLSIKEINKPYSLKIKEFMKELKSSFYKKKVNLELYIVTLRQLGVMLDAGISLIEALNEVVTSAKDKNIKKIFKQISSDIEMGISLTQAFEKFSYELGHISIAIINMGEQTGSLADAVTKLAFILEEIYENKKKLKKAIRYPLIILTTMIIAFIAITRMIVPQFKNMFEEYGAQLPLPTRLLIGLNEYLKNYSFLTLVIMIMITIIHTLLYKGNKKYKYICDNIFKKFTS
jgi:general secretion pathway protein F